MEFYKLYRVGVNQIAPNNPYPYNYEKLYGLHGGQVTWSTILLKNSHLFKIAELDFFFFK